MIFTGKFPAIETFACLARINYEIVSHFVSFKSKSVPVFNEIFLERNLQLSQVNPNSCLNSHVVQDRYLKIGNFRSSFLFVRKYSKSLQV